MRSTFHTFLSDSRQSCAHHAQVDKRERFDAPGEIDVGVEIAGRERARRGEHRLPPVQPRIARAGHGPPKGSDHSRGQTPFWLLVYEDHMIELVDRFEADDERRIPVLLEDRGGEQRRLEAVRRAMPDDAAKAAQRGAPGGGSCCRAARSGYRWTVERRAQPANEPALGEWCQASEQPFELGDELFWCPVGSRVAFDDPAVAADDGRAKRVADLVRIACRVGPPRTSVTSMLVAKRSISSRSPVTNVHMRGSAPSFSACCFSTAGVSFFGSKLTDSSAAFVSRPFVLDERLRLGELTIHRRTERRNRALRVDERDGDRPIAANGVEVALGRPGRRTPDSEPRRPAPNISRPASPVRPARDIGLRRAELGDFRDDTLVVVDLDLARDQVAGPRLSSMFAVRTFHGIVMAGIRPVISSCLTRISILSRLMPRICPRISYVFALLHDAAATSAATRTANRPNDSYVNAMLSCQWYIWAKGNRVVSR